MSSQEIQSAKMRLLGDLRAAVRYTPDQQADLVAFMQQYIKHLRTISCAKWQNFCVRKIPMPMLV